MPPLKISRFPEPVLSKISRPIDVVSDKEKALLDDMLETMYLNQGIGLAAPQVGVSKRAIVADVGEGPIQLINPIIEKRRGSGVSQEGCLSLPGAMVEVKRAEKISYKGINRDGKLVEDEAEGLLARALQHEIDHLDGKLIINYANPIKRIFLKKRLIEASKEKGS
jgi:peptide deformylase